MNTSGANRPLHARDGSPGSRIGRLLRAAVLVGASMLALPAGAAAAERPFLRSQSNTELASTIPASGDLNPYGVAVITSSAGALKAGSVLVSNFNNGEPGNEQGRGQTIVEVSPGGVVSQFAQVKPAEVPSLGGVGLTTALAVLPGGFVVVGDLPTSNGKAETAEPGGLIVLNDEGKLVKAIAGGPIDGPWDLTATSSGAISTLFVTNVLNGTVAAKGKVVDEGTVVRVTLHDSAKGPSVEGMRVIAGGFPERTDPSALVIGPTGVAFAPGGTLYVADTLGNRIAAVGDAITRTSPASEGGRTLAQGGYLNAPLGLALTPEGHLLSTNGGDSDIVETTPEGAEFQPYDTGAGEGGLFGLAVLPGHKDVVYVDDSTNTLNLLH